MCASVLCMYSTRGTFGVCSQFTTKGWGGKGLSLSENVAGYVCNQCLSKIFTNLVAIYCFPVSITESIMVSKTCERKISVPAQRTILSLVV